MLTCPNCRGGIPVAASTTAMVRCPTCKTVFLFKNSEEEAPKAPGGGHSAAHEDRKKAADPGPKTGSKSGAHAAPKTGTHAVAKSASGTGTHAVAKSASGTGTHAVPKTGAKSGAHPASETARHPAPSAGKTGETARLPKVQKADSEVERTKNRDFIPITQAEDRHRKRKARRREADQQLSPQERASRRRAFRRAALGTKLIWLALALYILSLAVVLLFFFQLALPVVTPVYMIFAGVLGAGNWAIGAVGIALCLTGPRTAGHWRYGVAALLTSLAHGVVLVTLFTQNVEFSPSDHAIDPTWPPDITPPTKWGDLDKWGKVATRMDATMLYITKAAFQRYEGFTPRGPVRLSMLAGLLEMVQMVLIMMLLSCLARSALDEDLAYKCIKAAGIASIGPGIVSVFLFVVVASLVELNAGLNLFARIMVVVAQVSVFSILIAALVPSLLVTREVVHACDEPFQSQAPQL